MFGRIITIALVVTVLWAVFARASESAGPPQAYVVKPGDSLWSIAAKQYAGDPREGVWKLRRVNDLSGSSIYPGQELLLP
jgi:LysM repeat protein